MLLDRNLSSKLHRFYLIGDVIIVDGNASLLMKNDALHTNLVKFLNFLAILTDLLQLKHTVLLVRFIFLCHDNFLEADWFLCADVKHLVLLSIAWLYV